MILHNHFEELLKLLNNKIFWNIRWSFQNYFKRCRALIVLLTEMFFTDVETKHLYFLEISKQLLWK